MFCPLRPISPDATARRAISRRSARSWTGGRCAAGFADRARAVRSRRSARSGGKGRVPLRPGREAAIIRRLLARHSGPARAAGAGSASGGNYWLEPLRMQGRHVITVCDARSGPRSYPDRARAFRRAHAAQRPRAARPRPGRRQCGQLLRRGAAAALRDRTAREAWWTTLLRPAGACGRIARGIEHRLRVVARLPFWAPRPERAPRGQRWSSAAVPARSLRRRPFLLGLDCRVRNQPCPPERASGLRTGCAPER